MTYIGKVLSWIFKPITFPLGWLFKHRCKMMDGTDVCESMFCDVGKRGVEGWTNLNRAGEWSIVPPRPKLPAVVPPLPPQRGFARYYSESQLVSSNIKGQEVLIAADMNVDVDVNEGLGYILINAKGPGHVKVTFRDDKPLQKV